MLVMRPTGEIIDANQAAALTYGYTKDELLAMTVFDLHPQQGHDPVQSVMNRAMTASLLYEALHVCKDGSVIPVEVSSTGGFRRWSAGSN